MTFQTTEIVASWDRGRLARKSAVRRFGTLGSSCVSTTRASRSRRARRPRSQGAAGETPAVPGSHDLGNLEDISDS
jgi:hypothetical protein